MGRLRGSARWGPRGPLLLAEVGDERRLLPYLDRLERGALERDRERARKRGAYIPRTADVQPIWNPWAA